MNLLEEYTNFAVVIDDMPAEASRLRIELKKAGIHSVYMNPNRNLGSNDIKASQRIPNTSLIFLDLFMNPHSNELNGHISFLRGILESLIGNTTDSYGIILWTKNSEHFSKFLAKIEEDRDTYSLPSFVFMLKKEDYRNGYEALIDDINKGLEANLAARFAVLWDINVRKAKNDTIGKFYSLLPYSKPIKNTNLEFLLYKLAESQTGIKHQKLEDITLLNKEIFNSFSDLMSDALSNQHLAIPVFEECQKEKILYQGTEEPTREFSFSLGEEKYYQFENSEQSELTDGTKREKLGSEINTIIRKLNSMLFLDNPDDIISLPILPGNIYEIQKPDCPLDIRCSLASLPDDVEVIPIVIVMDPPCDFASDKLYHHRLLGGAIIKGKINKKVIQSEYLYSKNLVNSIDIGGKEATPLFDFRFIGLEEKSAFKPECINYKFVFRVKKSLFSDILQKMSSYAARLGVGSIGQIK